VPLPRLAVDADALDQDGLKTRVLVIPLAMPGFARLRAVSLPSNKHAVVPGGFHRIRHYGLFAGTVRARNFERARQLLATATPDTPPAEADNKPEPPQSPARRCPCCGGRMIIVETFQGVRAARPPSPSRIRIDTS